MRTLAAVVLMAATLGAQAAFDVVSIKPAGAGAPPLVVGPYVLTVKNGRLRAPGMTAMGLITRAFETQAAMVVGAPGWVTTAQYEILATIGGGRDVDIPAQMPALLRSLLENRFKLKTRVERRPFPVYALVKARRDGRLGPALSPSTCARDQSCYGDTIGRNFIESPRMTMESLVRAFTRLGLADRIVVDRTGLTGDFGLEVVWAAQTTEEGASLFTAMQEQLGLKLEPRTEPIEALVIEHIEPPEPN